MNIVSRLILERNVAAALGALVSLALVSCERSKEGSSTRTSGKPVVFASVAPVAGLVKRIAGDRVEVETLAGPDQDPHGFSPAPKQLVALGESDAFFVVGMPFENRLVSKLKESSKGLRVIDVADDIEKLELDEHHHHHGHDHGHEEHGHDEHEHDDHEGHDHANEDDHGHDGHAAHEGELDDPHVWLSPALLKKQAILIEHALMDIDPAGHDAYHANLDQLLGELDALDAELQEALAPLKGQSFFVYHGAFGYFAQAYGLKQEAIESGGRSPEPKRVFELIEQAKKDGIKLVIVQPQFDTHSAEAIAEGIGGAVVPVNPMDDDVFATLRQLAEKVKAATE